MKHKGQAPYQPPSECSLFLGVLEQRGHMADRLRACACAAALAMLPLATLVWGSAMSVRAPAPSEVDLSGYGVCDGTAVRVLAAST